MTPNTQHRDPVTIELLDWIQHTTEHIRGSAQGLTEDQVRAPAAPSGWSIAGLVGHVRDSTGFWLHNVVAGHPMDFQEDTAWDNDPDVPFATLLEDLRRTTGAEARAAVEHIASGSAPLWWPEGAWGGYRQSTVRGVLLHVFNDNAAHTGQLDIAREQIDGGVWDFGRNGVRVRRAGPEA
ncbi:DinB family protein [Occultella kanbiaonis]|uniref:DinB family protein n=1 Tax=Occultella kanbiaonis TaxID=2675754 RepID=UPI0012B9CD38|nr:DinB family protein [Occultella kanbiaonis]